MREQLQSRRDELKKEFEAGQARLHELERQQSFMRETLLRISGAIQVIEELLAQESGPTAEGGESIRKAAKAIDVAA